MLLGSGRRMTVGMGAAVGPCEAGGDSFKAGAAVGSCDAGGSDEKDEQRPLATLLGRGRRKAWGEDEVADNEDCLLQQLAVDLVGKQEFYIGDVEEEPVARSRLSSGDFVPAAAGPSLLGDAIAKKQYKADSSAARALEDGIAAGRLIIFEAEGAGWDHHAGSLAESRHLLAAMEKALAEIRCSASCEV
mmetsp:Transcript_114135/g.362848  ORF Transcript_114135/g.362848 Transcript_114135/m.362848 type:complete len:189 (-) Transcript_114135:121-687(-)